MYSKLLDLFRIKSSIDTRSIEITDSIHGESAGPCYANYSVQLYLPITNGILLCIVTTDIDENYTQTLASLSFYLIIIKDRMISRSCLNLLVYWSIDNYR